MSAYSDRLKDPRWQKKRLEILNRDDWACQFCFDKETTLHVHHRFYTRGAMPWEYDDKALITLCAPCHAEETEMLPGEEKALLDTLKLGGANSSDLNELMDSLAAIRETPFFNNEWSVLCWHIRNLLRDRDKRGDQWALLREEFSAWINKGHR